MRPFLFVKCLALITPLLSTAVLAQNNLVLNGDFESRYQAPRGTNNIGLVTGSTPATDLQDWYRTPTSTSTTPITNYPDYVATDGVPTANPATYFSANYPNLNTNYSFAPHGGQSCVVLYQHNVNGDHRYNSIITRKLGSALIPGHVYQVEYWARRLASDRYRTELALYLTNSAPTFDGDYQPYPGTQPSHIISPSPSNKILQSGDIRDTQNWTRVSGTITPNDQGNQWITIGYAATNQQYDSSIPGYNANGIYYAIDDVSVIDLTCRDNPPVAGPNQIICSGQPVTIGQGCPPVGATYEWREENALATFATTLQTTVIPSVSTTYILTVRQPNGSTSTSQVTVSVFNADMAPSYYLVNADDCGKIYTYQIADFNPNFFTYTVRTSGVTVMGQPRAVTGGQFRLKGGGGSTGGTFTVTATACSVSATSELDGLSFNCSQPTPIYRTAATTAYPNPANESVSVPDGVEGATLLNSASEPVQKADASGKLDLRSLPDGLYNLQMMQNGKLINQRIQVKH